MEIILPHKGMAVWIIQSSESTQSKVPQQMIVRGLTCLLLCVLGGIAVFGQTATPTPLTVKKGPVPPTILWYHFLLSVNHNDRAAAKRQLVGKDGTWLRNLHQVKLGFADDQFVPIRTTAQKMAAELMDIGGKIRTFEQAGQPLLPGSPLPPDLAALMQQRKTVIWGEVSNLQSALGPDLTAKLDGYIKNCIAPNVTFQYVHSGTPVAPYRLQEILREKQLMKGVQP